MEAARPLDSSFGFFGLSCGDFWPFWPFVWYFYLECTCGIYSIFRVVCHICVMEDKPIVDDLKATRLCVWPLWPFVTWFLAFRVVFLPFVWYILLFV